MEIAVHDSDGTLLGFIDNFTSLLWTRRYSSAGSFELCVPAAKGNTELLAPVRFVRRTDNGEAMYISTVREESDSDGEITIVVSGYSLDGLFRKLAMPLDTQEYYTVYSNKEYDSVHIWNIMSAQGTGDTAKLTGTLSLPLYAYEPLPEFKYIHKNSEQIKKLIKQRDEFDALCGPRDKWTQDMIDIHNAFTAKITSLYASTGIYYAVNMSVEDYMREILSSNGYRIDTFLNQNGIGYAFVKPKYFESHNSPVFSTALETVSDANFECSEEGCYNAIRVVCSEPADGVQVGTDEEIQYALPDKLTFPVYYGTVDNYWLGTEGGIIGTKYTQKTVSIEPVTAIGDRNGKNYTYASLSETMALAYRTIEEYLGKAGFTEHFSGDVTDVYKYRVDYDVGDNVAVQSFRGSYRKIIEEVQESFDESGYKINVTFGEPLKTLVDDYSEKYAACADRDSSLDSKIQNRVAVGSQTGSCVYDRVKGVTWTDSHISKKDYVNEG